MSILNKAGFVRSVRGPQGGYFLTRKPEEYTVGMILRLTEGSLSPVDCLDEGAENCPRQESCVTFILWKQLNDAIRGVVDKVTLQDLVDWSQVQGQDYCCLLYTSYCYVCSTGKKCPDCFHSVE